MSGPENDNQLQILETAVQQFVDSWLDGQAPEIDKFVKGYPGYEDQIRERISKLHRIDGLFDSLVRADDIDFQGTIALPDLLGQKLGSFEVSRVIGHGGMGVVYLAHDTKLDRSVAIKSIPSNLAGDVSVQSRFRREAKLLASLNHPNIAAIYDIIEQDAGAGYLVLEYIPGETLDQCIVRETLSLKEALAIGQQVAEAISAAHDKGVIHRDLKPSNIKITPEGKVKVLDFGLAKASVVKDRIAATTITQPGRVIGTPAYMSPEQARGKPTDHHTDIWSFGCILYEMLTGNLPFAGETATDTVARILEREPDWELLPQEIPTNIRTLLRRCLEKDPRQRLRDIGDAAIEIKETLSLPAAATGARSAAPVRSVWQWVIVMGLIVVALMVLLVVEPHVGAWKQKQQGSTDSGRIESLAVLPLQNLTGDPNQEVFVDGITCSLIAELGQIGALDVKSRTSTMLYKDTKESLSQIAGTLKVDVLVEGSVLRLGQRVHISAKLIDARTDTHLWADTYKRDPRDILIIYSEITRAIAKEIEITLTPEQEERLAARRTINPDAYNLYVWGMFHLRKKTPEGTTIGLDYLRQAIEHDPMHPLPYGALALGYAMSGHGPGAPLDAFDQARKTAFQALALDDNVAEAHAALAMTKAFRDWDWEGATKAYERALQLNPHLTMTRAQYAFYLLLFDRVDDALTQIRKVQEANPLVPLWSAYLGWVYLWAQQYDEVIKETNKALELSPNFPLALYVQGRAYAEKGMYDQAIELHKKAGELSPGWNCGLAHTYAKAGRLDEARQTLTEMEANYTPWDTWFIAMVYVTLGEKDEAFRWLEVAYGPPNHQYLPWMRHSPDFRPLRDDQHFQDLLRRMNLF